MARIPKPDATVQAVYDSYPPASRKLLMAARKLIYQTAAEVDGVGALTETLKWGEPAYVTDATKSGSTIRLACPKKFPDQPKMLFNCNTTLVDGFKFMFADDLNFEGNRAIVLDPQSPLPSTQLQFCIEDALTYNLKKRRAG